jgi:hypothetical protein
MRKSIARLSAAGRWKAARLLGCFAAVLVASGCATLIKERTDGKWIKILPGSTLTLSRPISVPPGRSRVFFVNGRVRTSGANYRPSCALEVRRIDRDGPLTIPAGAIRITRVQNYWTEVVDRRDPAAAELRLAGGDYGYDGGGYSMIQTGFHLWLDDSANPDLMRMTCLGVLADPAESYPPTVAEINAALGKLARLDVLSTPR